MPAEPPRIQLYSPFTRRVEPLEPLEPRMVAVRDTQRPGVEDRIALTGTSPHSRLDLVVVGAGIMGLATARRLLLERPGLRVLVVETEAAIARHQTGRNSGVVHRGIYNGPGSLKARLCVRGADQLTAYCDARGIPWQRLRSLAIADLIADAWRAPVDS